MYCHKCGQYALDVDQNFFMYIKQFFENAYQFDGKAFQTLRILFMHPGLLSKEFIAGKINSYVHPMKLYMCVSLIFFSFILVLYSTDSYTNKVVGTIEEMNTTKKARKDTLSVKVPMMMQQDTLKTLSYALNFSSDTLKHASDTTRDMNSWRKEAKGLYQEVFARSSQYLPFLLLALLPIFAFLLRLLFRKTYRPYMSHFVFSVHIHTVFLIMFTLTILVNIMTDIFLVYKYMPVLFTLYLLLAVRGFYRNNWFKTVVKTGIVSFLYASIFILATSAVLIAILAQASDKY